ncbi:MAG TPA: trigger factor [Thermoanaerobacterales bacterium]|nr:trigger factor [Thermoanaerobacterales bacterium]
MKANLEKIENNIAMLEIEVDADRFEEAMNRAYKKNVKKINVPGFRKGHAPRKIIEIHFGEGIFYEDAINFIIPEVFPYAVEETGIEPVEQPSITDIVQIESGKPFIFKAEVTVKPEVKLGEYKGLELEKLEFEVTEETVNQELERMREQNARLVSVDNKPSEKGDTVVIDFEGFIDNEPIEGGKAENYFLEIGSKSLIEGFEEQLVGCLPDEEKEIHVKFPDDYSAEEIAGKDAVFNVKVKEIKVKELPELNDEFAKEISEHETLKELRDDLENKIKEALERATQTKLENDAINKAVEAAEVEIPQVMIDNEIDLLLRDFVVKLSYSGISLEQYLEYSGLNEEDMRERFKDEAYNNVKRSLVLEAIAKTENIQADEEEVEKSIKDIADSSNKDIEEIRKSIGEEQLNYIKKNIIMRKTVDFLVNNSTIKVTNKTTSDVFDEGEEEKQISPNE